MDTYAKDIEQLCRALYNIDQKIDSEWIYGWKKAVEKFYEHLYTSPGRGVYSLIELPGNWEDPYKYYFENDHSVFDTLLCEGITKEKITFYISYLKLLSDHYRFTYSQFESLVNHFLKTHYIQIWILDHGGIKGLQTYNSDRHHQAQVPVFDTKLVVGSLIFTAILAWWLTKQH